MVNRSRTITRIRKGTRKKKKKKKGINGSIKLSAKKLNLSYDPIMPMRGVKYNREFPNLKSVKSELLKIDKNEEHIDFLKTYYNKEQFSKIFEEISSGTTTFKESIDILEQVIDSMSKEYYDKVMDLITYSSKKDIEDMSFLYVTTTNKNWDKLKKKIKRNKKKDGNYLAKVKDLLFYYSEATIQGVYGNGDGIDLSNIDVVDEESKKLKTQLNKNNDNYFRKLFDLKHILSHGDIRDFELINSNVVNKLWEDNKKEINSKLKSTKHSILDEFTKTDTHIHSDILSNSNANSNANSNSN